MNDTYYVKTEEKEHTVKIQNKDEKFYAYDAELVENPTGTLVEKTIIENGEYLPASDNADGYSKVTVNVPSSGLPTLFAPIITAGVNTVSWANDTRNGSFAVTLSATVDGVAVTSPLTITEQMDGKTLIVMASAENFESSVSTAQLQFIMKQEHLVTIRSAPENGLRITQIGSSVKFSKDGITTQHILWWDNVAGSEKFENVVTLADNTSSADIVSFVIYQPSSLKSRTFLPVSGGSGFGNVQKTGSITIENLTKNMSRVASFNNSDTTNRIDLSSWDIGDELRFSITLD